MFWQSWTIESSRCIYFLKNSLIILFSVLFQYLQWKETMYSPFNGNYSSLCQAGFYSAIYRNMINCLTLEEIKKSCTQWGVLFFLKRQVTLVMGVLIYIPLHLLLAYQLVQYWNWLNLWKHLHVSQLGPCLVLKTVAGYEVHLRVFSVWNLWSIKSGLEHIFSITQMK